MAKNNLFSSYRQGENRVTASMLAVFERIDLGVVEQLLAAASGESSLAFVTFANQVAGPAGSVPDAGISASFRYLFEVKTVAAAVRLTQLEDHLKLLNGKYAEERLLVITPDPAQPKEVADLSDQRLVWFNFASLNQAIEGVLSDPTVVISEQERFLLRELQALFLQEGLLGHNDVVVVAARKAYPEYLAQSAYICGAGRSFRKGLTRMGFYTNNAIQREFPQIVGWKDNVTITRDTVATLGEQGNEPDVEIARWIEKWLARDPQAEGLVLQVFLLSPPDDERTIKLRDRIRNTAVDRNGQPTAWTQGQRYIRSDILKTEPETTDELDVRIGSRTAGKDKAP